MTAENDPRTAHHEDGFEEQEQTQPGLTSEMTPTSRSCACRRSRPTATTPVA